MKRNMILILLVSVVLALVVTIAGNREREFAERNSYGGGAKTEEYEVSVEGLIENQKIQLDIPERVYTQEEVMEVFDTVMEKLDTIILGENESFDHVEKDLNLVSEVEGYPISIRWQMDSYEVLGVDGKIFKEKTTEKGTLVEICGILSYGEEEAMYVRTVCVYPETKTGDAAVLARVQELFDKQEALSREKINIALPDMLDGKEIRWKTPSDQKGLVILLLGAVFAIYLPVRERQKEKENEKQRREQLLRDYPKLVAEFALLIETGMTVKHAWEKLLLQYENQSRYGRERVLLKEMKETCREMQGGIPEAESYERFGKRCAVSEYRKFGALLSQNLRKGTKGLASLLRVESVQATENRKNRAKRKAEEAGTKLLVPMFAMLGIVLVVVIVPAFWSMQM